MKQKGVEMFIQNEKDMEDYICNNIEKFEKFLQEEVLKDNMLVDEIKFIGRQVNVAGKFIDLLFESWTSYPYGNDGSNEFVCRTFIVVELKHRTLAANDLAQLCMYLNILDEFKEVNETEYSIFPTIGILVGLDMDDNTQEIEMCLSEIQDDRSQRIYFALANTDINFREGNFSHTGDYIASINFDERIKR